MKYKIQDKEAGNIIDECSTQEDAEALVEKYENEDRKNNNYTTDFYEIKLKQ